MREESRVKLASWNVNGIRAVQRKGALDWIWNSDLDAVCLQETKAHPEQLEPALTAPPGWRAQLGRGREEGLQRRGHLSCARGSAVAGERAGFGVKRFDSEGRTLVTDFGAFLLYNVYFPNGKASEERLAYKMDFYAAFRKHVNAQVKSGRRVVICGDVNTAHRPIDLARPEENEKISGFLPEERAWLDAFTKDGWVDTFRAVQGDTPDVYTWWSQRSGARLRNIGWRIDYFFVDAGLRPALLRCLDPARAHGLRSLPAGHRALALAARRQVLRSVPVPQGSGGQVDRLVR